MKIRFRVWDGKVMWYPEDGQFMLKQDGAIRDETGHLIEADAQECAPIPLLSTGLKDGNGKEIWGGDICRHSIVGLMDVDSQDFQATRYIFPAFGKTVKVVGNKYENPELLKEVA